MKYCIYILLIIFVSACIPPSTEQIESITSPDIQLDKKYNKKCRQQIILYQYYENFGFTDVVVHYRVLYSINTQEDEQQLLTQLKWKKLPISPTDLEAVNQMIVHDTLTANQTNYTVVFKKKYAFADIRNEAKEFIASSDSCIIQLKTGYYYVEDNLFFVYDRVNKKLYYEYYEF